MAVKIKRVLSAKQRNAMIRRKTALAKIIVARTPSVATVSLGYHVPTPRKTGRRWKKGAENTPRPNIVIVRTQHKRGRRIRVTGPELKSIYDETFDIRELMISGTVKHAVLLRVIGEAMSRNAKARIRQNLQPNTGDLLSSISFEVKA